MPWYLSTMLFATLVLVPLHALVLWRGARALRVAFGLRRGLVFAGSVAVWCVLLAGPLVALIAFRFSEAGRWPEASAVLVERILYGHPLTDVLFVYPFWFGMIATIQLGPLLLLWELVLARIPLARLPFGRWSRLSADEILVWRGRLVLVFLLLGGVYVGGRMYFDTNTVRSIRTDLAIPALPAALDGLRIVHISDIQADYYTSANKLDRYAQAINRLEPDLVVFTGDLITRDPDFVDAGAALLGQLTTSYGVYAALGDHDVWYAPNRIRSALRREGVILKEDQNATITVDGVELGLTILTTTYRRRPSMNRLRRLARALGDRPRIMMAHQPLADVVEFARHQGYALFLGGHTHGGQVAFSYFGWELSASLKETNFVSGLYFDGDMPVHVNNGLGLTFAPVRFQAPAGVALLVLQRKE